MWGIVLVILFERIMLESYKASLTFSIDLECTYSYVYEHMKFGHKHKYVQIILVLISKVDINFVC